MKWKNGQDFVRQVQTPISSANARLLEQGDIISNTTPEPSVNGGLKGPHNNAVRMLTHVLA